MKHPNELDQQLDNLRTLQESYDQIAGAAEAYNVGKPLLARNITAKGVQASADETLPELAEKVAAISQETLQIDGGEMYAKQLFGSLETPNYWNLYEVLADLLSDGRLVSYGGILLAEYYRGYDSLALAGAGAGGAYVVSDKNSDGQFIMYTEDTTHTWATEFDGKGNRWVAYCFADEYHDFQITNTDTSPRSIFIGRKVGTINCLVATRIANIVVPDGSELYKLSSGTLSHNFGRNLVIRHLLNTPNTGDLIVASNALENVYMEIEHLQNCRLIVGGAVTGKNINIIAKIGSCDTFTGSNLALIQDVGNIGFLYIETDILYFSSKKIVFGGSIGDMYIIADRMNHNYQTNDNGAFFAYVRINKAHIYTEQYYGTLNYSGGCKYLYIGYITNDKTRSIVFTSPTGSATTPEIIELQDGICKNITLDNMANSISESNIYIYILQRLKQDEPDCGDGVTITLGQTNLNKLTSEESLALLDELTNTYGYTFA